MNDYNNDRIAYYDNLKFFLILTVVVGHFINVNIAQSNIFKSAYLWIFSFHMPALIFLNGLFHKNHHVLPRILGLLSIGFV